MAANAVYIRDFRKEIPGELSEDKLTWVFPEIKSINAHGKNTTWIVCVKLFESGIENVFLPILDEYFDNKPLASNLRGWIKVDSRVGKGVIKKSVPTIVNSGKNLGKASATNVFCQSLRDALSMYNKQVKKSALTGTNGVVRYPPMLAQVLNKQKNLIIDDKNPLWLQDKFDGVRAIVTLDNDVALMYSRGCMTYSGFDYIKDELFPILKDYWGAGRQLYLDGEIYKHGAKLQDISGHARRESQPTDTKYNYMLFDCFIANEPELNQVKRDMIREEISQRYQLDYSIIVPSKIFYNRDDINEYYKERIAAGYEGVMARKNTPYVFSYNARHSNTLLKIKPTHDAEYTIVRWTTGDKGKAADALMIVCKTEGGIEFPVTPAMELPERITLAKKMQSVEPNMKTHFENHWLGQPLIVYYDDLSRDNVPQRARTKMEIRTWE